MEMKKYVAEENLCERVVSHRADIWLYAADTILTHMHRSFPLIKSGGAAVMVSLKIYIVPTIPHTIYCFKIIIARL